MGNPVNKSTIRPFLANTNLVAFIEVVTNVATEVTTGVWVSTFRMLLAISLASLCLATARADITVEPHNDHQPDEKKILPKADQMGSSLHSCARPIRTVIGSNDKVLQARQDFIMLDIRHQNLPDNEAEV